MFLKEFFEMSADVNKKHEKLPNMQRINYYNDLELELLINPLRSVNPINGYFANSDDLDEMPQRNE